MTDKINHIDMDTLLGRLIIRACLQLPKNTREDYFRALRQCDNHKFDIQFSVDGIQLPVVKAFETIEAELDDIIRQRAEKLIAECFGDKLQAVDDSVDKIRELVEDAAETLRTELINKLNATPAPEN